MYFNDKILIPVVAFYISRNYSVTHIIYFMQITKVCNPKDVLNKAYRKVKPIRSYIEKFKSNLIGLLESINEKETEEFHKNLVIEFLKNTWYQPDYFINTKGRNDLVIHNGKDAKSPVGVLLEAKKPTNKSEMLRKENINCKALQELLLYYLRERITGKNLEIKYIIATNINEWYVFDAIVFEKYFAHNNQLTKLFIDFEEGRLAGTTTDFFYKDIADPAIKAVQDNLTFTYFNIRDYEKPLRNNNDADDNKLIVLYKLLSPEHLLKLPFINDSNNLDKAFYGELLHIMGLSEIKDKGKKLINRKEESKRYSGSLLENTISQLESRDKIGRLEKPSKYGNNHNERLYNVGLELVITWINRILFLKLLEGQLISYHKGDISFTFLTKEKIQNYDDLDNLFFSVLAKKTKDRDDEVKQIFFNVPYLNSSLFEPTDMEQWTLFISNLRDERKLPIYSNTVLKDATGKKRVGEITALEYLFEFMNAYDFSSEGVEEIQEDNKSLINASVLGLIFEKINGYKDGSFFTPGFITMYMCKETIRRAVLQKFKEAKGWECDNLDQLFDKIEDKKEANAIINSLHICDPAVGSGHFLVSALNEIIAIKSELKILLDMQGKTLRDYHIQVENDELIITDDNGDFYSYNPKNPESQRIQEALFHEKQTIIEECLFGVDINPNSVKICRLRLWIELLKNAYYNGNELQTLPNIDINIKCGNSLISRYSLDADLKQALKKSKWSITSYRNAVNVYRNASGKEEKREMERLIAEIKSNFRSEISKNDKKVVQLYKLKGELFNLTSQTSIFGMTPKEKAVWEKEVAQKTTQIEKLETEIEEIKNNKIYENAFEWRFEFPEVLNDEGDFDGFDVVIGNPPYIRQEEISWMKVFLKQNFKTYSGTSDLYVFFVELSFNILKLSGKFGFIMPNKWMQAGYGKPLRSFLKKQTLHNIIDFGDLQVFEEATTYPCILSASKGNENKFFKSTIVRSLQYENGFENYVKATSIEMDATELSDETWMISSAIDKIILNKVWDNSTTLLNYVNGDSCRGILTGLSEAFIISKEIKEKLVFEDENSLDLLKPFLLGRNISAFASAEVENWLILIPKGFTNFKKGKSIHSWEWFSGEYKAIANYLLPFKERAEKRTDKGDYWWELRACDYYQKFENPKIMYQKFQVKPCFIFDESGVFCNDSMWIIPKDDKALIGLLNSNMGWWLISKYCTAIQNGYQLIWKYFGQIPIPTDIISKGSEIENLVTQVIQQKKQDPNADISVMENQIDVYVYHLYQLSYEEVKIIDSKFLLSEEEYYEVHKEHYSI